LGELEMSGNTSPIPQIEHFLTFELLVLFAVCLFHRV
jgi:hypothetical protein